MFSMNYKFGKPGKSNKGQSGAVIAIADTGAAVSVMPINHAKRLGVSIDTSKLPKLRAANGKLLKSVGVAKMYVRISPCPSYTEVQFTVTSQGGDILVGNSDLKLMGIIDADFPSWKEASNMRINGGKAEKCSDTGTNSGTTSDMSSSVDDGISLVTESADASAATDASSPVEGQGHTTVTN